MTNLLTPVDPREAMAMEEMRSEEYRAPQQLPIGGTFERMSYKPASLEQMQAEAELRFAIALLRTGLDHFNGLIGVSTINESVVKLCQDVVRAHKRVKRASDAKPIPAK